MKLKVVEKYEAVIIELSGSALGGQEANDFSEILRKLLAENKKHIVVDLGEVTFMNSSGLGMLISGLTTVKKENASFKLARVTEKIESLLVITKLTTIFEYYDTVASAIKSFAK